MLPIVVAELLLSSWETMARRTWMMTQDSCSPAEYRRMMSEKMSAAAQSASVLARRRGRGAVIAALLPWHRRATANAKRLRKRQSSRST